MKKVYQDRFGFEGNCVWACISSVFDIPLDELRFPPASVQALEAWSEANLPHLKFRNQDLATNFRLEGDFPHAEGVGTERWAYDLPERWYPPKAAATGGYWLASVYSLGMEREENDPYYPLPSLHMVVMRGRELVHDPNPNYADRVPYTPTVVMKTWWTKPPGADSNR